MVKKNILTEPQLPHSEFQYLIDIIKKGHYEKVKQESKELLKKYPNSVPLLKLSGIAHSQKKEYSNAIYFFKRALKIDSVDSNLFYNLGLTYQLLGDFLEAKQYYKKALALNPKDLNLLNNLGIVERETGELDAATETLKSAILLKSNFAPAYNALGNVKNDQGEKIIALELYSKAFFYDSSFSEAAYNIHSLQSTNTMALKCLEKCLSVNSNYFPAEFMYGALQDYEGCSSFFVNLIKKYGSNHPYIRSYNWIKSLPNQPKIFLNRWDFFDGITHFCKSNRPFYEYGVWTANSFRYLLNFFETGFGFDTFLGLPEDWHDKKSGSYTNYGKIPKVDRGELIVGKFEESLPIFFSQKRDLASLINFDCDLYSSTSCALKWSESVIDQDTILVFDEFIMNEFWEKDEYRALLEFCENNNNSFEVIAVSLVSKQVAVKLIS